LPKGKHGSTSTLFTADLDLRTGRCGRRRPPEARL